MGLNSLQVGRRYFWMHGLSAVAVAGTSYFLLVQAPFMAKSEPWLYGFLVFGGLYGIVKGGKWEKASIPLYAIAAGSGVISLCLIWANHPLKEGLSQWMSLANGLLSVGLLGGSLAAMLLGHWYLIQPRLSIDELKKLSRVLIAFIVVRFLFSSWVLFESLPPGGEAQLYRYFLATTPGIFSLMRWAWGLLGSLVLSYFLWGTVKIRSTQSATGILYVIVLAVLTGETLSLYLILNYGIPL